MSHAEPLEQAAQVEHSFLAGVFMAANMGGRSDTEVVDALYAAGNESVFALPKHQEVIRAFRGAFEEGGVSSVADPVKVFGRLRRGVFDDFEGLVSFLQDHSRPAIDLSYALQEVKDGHIRRQLSLIGSNLQARSNAPMAVEDVINDVVSSLMRLREGQVVRGGAATIHYADGLRDALVAIEEARERHLAGIPIDVARSGIAFLDKILNGGLRPGTLTVLAARPGIGKTAFMLQWLINAIITMGDPEAYGTLAILEMTLREVVFRDLSNETEIFSSKMWQGTVSDYEMEIIRKTVARLSTCRNILAHERVSNVDDCISLFHGDMMRQGRKPVLLAVDYLQLLQLESISGVSINSSKAVGQISRKLKIFAKDQDVPVLLLSQLNREVESRSGRRPVLSDLRDSGEVEQDADNVIFLWPKSPTSTEEPDQTTRTVCVAVDKHRNGPTGEGELTFYKAKTHFEALTGERETDPAPAHRVPAGAITQRLVDLPGDDEDGDGR